MNKLPPTKPSADNAGGFLRLTFTRPTSSGGKEKKQQVTPALRLPAQRWLQFFEETNFKI